MAAPLLLHVYPTFAVGGAQVRFAAIANRFGPAFRHVIVALDGNTACRERLSGELDVRFVDVAVRKRDTLGSVRQFRRLLRELRPDVLVTANWGSIEWAMANVLPVARHIHVEDGFGPEERSGQLWRRTITRSLVLRRSTVVVPSRVLWGLATGAWRLQPSRVRHIPNGIDLSRYAPRTDVAAAGRGLVVGTVAALRPEKNLARLIRAFAIAAAGTTARLRIVGGGAERGSLEALAGELGLDGRVEFVGPIAQPASLYAEFDIFALSSDTEQMPLSVLEAMGTGLPVVATDVGDVRSMLAEANGEFVTRQDDGAYGNALRRLLGDAAARVRIGAANRAKAVRDYDQETMFQAYGALFMGTEGLLG
jgi:glycosyltransferase involved in cell wall biosynthesis